MGKAGGGEPGKVASPGIVPACPDSIKSFVFMGFEGVPDVGLVGGEFLGEGGVG